MWGSERFGQAVSGMFRDKYEYARLGDVGGSEILEAVLFPCASRSKARPSGPDFWSFFNPICRGFQLFSYSSWNPIPVVVSPSEPPIAVTESKVKPNRSEMRIAFHAL